MFVRGSASIGRRSPLVDELVLVEDSEMGLGVPNVHS
jgi:hypothetical protein